MIICADDYGLSHGVSRGILELIDGERLTATSCMVTGSKDLPLQMAMLAERKEMADIGLHLTLTNDRPLTDIRPDQGLVDADGDLLPFKRLMRNCYRGRVDTTQLALEIKAQLTRFTELTGFQPTFIDGHQHVQQLPGVRDILIRICADVLQDDYYIRCGCFPKRWLANRALPTRMKIGSALIGLPAIGLKRVIKRNEVRHNDNLLGHYSSKEHLSFPEIFNRYLHLQPAANDIFYVHPGYIDDELKAKDPFVNERVSELEFLRGDRFLAELDAFGIGLNRYCFR
ncbi:MAG: ChbG/HpnK family deacetylase [Alphaproteobacteria bacterium]|nr:ChbG/HpnK family deacetylase [Alphaproteobacteria bacterium]